MRMTKQHKNHLQSVIIVMTLSEASIFPRICRKFGRLFEVMTPINAYDYYVTNILMAAKRDLSVGKQKYFWKLTSFMVIPPYCSSLQWYILQRSLRAEYPEKIAQCVVTRSFAFVACFICLCILACYICQNHNTSHATGF